VGVNGAPPQSTFQPLRAALRPPRAIVIIDGGDNWLGNAALGMYSCGRIWGGSGFILIPHHDGKISRSLRRLARAYDPDYVVTLPITVGQFEAIKPGALPLFVDGKPVEGADREAAIEELKDRPLNDRASRDARAIVARDCTPHRQWLPDRDGAGDTYLEQTEQLTASDYGGPFTSIEKFGPSQVSEVGVPPDLAGPWALAAALHVGFAQVLPPPLPEASPAEEAAITRLIEEALRPPSWEGFGGSVQEPEKPRWGSAWQPSETGLVKVGSWEGDQQPYLVVVGDTADDFALAQGWHVLFGKARWIPESQLPLTGPVERVAWFLRHDLVNDGMYRTKGPVLTSASVPLDQLEQLAEDWDDSRFMIMNPSGDAAEAGGPRPDPDLQVKCIPPDILNWDHGGRLVIREDYDLPLALPAQESDQGDISLLVDLPPLTPSDSVLRKVKRLTWQVDLHFTDATTPHTRGVSPRVLQSDDERRYESFVRHGRHGLTCFSGGWGFVAGGSTQIQAMAKPRLRLPGLYSWAQALAEDQDLIVRFSAAGHRVEILRRMWDSRAALAEDWAGSLRPIFLAFRKTEKMTRDAFPEGGGLVLASIGPVLSFAGMMSVVEASTDLQIRKLRSDIDRLCLIGVMRRGLALDCEACGRVGFIPVDAVSKINSCVRCGAQNNLTVDRWREPIKEPTWWYDLHEAARELLDADTGIAVLCSAYLRQSARSYADLSELEFFKHDNAVAEIDLLATRDDLVIIGEAKTTPGLGTRNQRVSKAQKLAMVAHVLHADQILLCTSAADNWPEIDVKAVKAAITNRFAAAPDQPIIRVITGLGTSEVNDLTL
jgi:hypothetical protein